MKKLFLIVLYKSKIRDSQICKSIVKNKLQTFSENHFLIWDNSPDKINTASDCGIFFKTKNIDFHHTAQNISLAKIYNYAFDEYSDFDAIQIFDQDSEIKKDCYDDYLNEIFFKNQNIPVFLPKIFVNGRLYSPGKLKICRGHHFSDLPFGVNKHRFYTAIMSGTVVRPTFLKEHGIRFNEDLTLYCIDTDFFNKCRKVDPHFFVMDIDFNHELSEASLSVEEKKERRKLQVAGLKVMYKGHGFLLLSVYIYEAALKVLGRI